VLVLVVAAGAIFLQVDGPVMAIQLVGELVIGITRMVATAGAMVLPVVRAQSGQGHHLMGVHMVMVVMVVQVAIIMEEMRAIILVMEVAVADFMTSLIMVVILEDQEVQVYVFYTLIHLLMLLLVVLI
jgi:hypothetical protein